MSYDTGYNIDTVLAILDFFSKRNKIMFSRPTSEIAIKNWARYNTNNGPEVKKLVEKELALVKNRELIDWMMETPLDNPSGGA